ncbi:type I-B CRISPR-associated endonuclease Cas1b [Rubrivirga sp. S365]|uniref:type I-B CRISPR-associated endonuclease Cas1b n=1 Tax=Rubrivirga sp. S365 TaxID=3076080 RepID=UPI0028C5D354|nr:type I-B CRISPR-associated endonuclease Cas1b [Rubrivirga sp. S365]MDT7858113.1 type I-B CRISPR-associated endonuclease Cas1b [Rubrivirga sp. S365]
MPRDHYLFSNGRLRRRQNTLWFERATGDRIPADDPDDTGAPSGSLVGEKAVLPVEAVDALHLFGEVDLNSKLVVFLAQQRVPVHVYDYYGNYAATLYPREYLLSGRLTVAQADHYLRPTKRLALARAFVGASLFNVRRTLLYHEKRAGDAGPIRDALAAVEREAARVPDEPAVPELMAAEGRARDAYYRAWPAVLGPATAAAFPYDGRTRRPPQNALNAAISFGNALCYAVCLKALYRTALDPTVSFLHEPGDRRYSLALDLAEVFKPLLVDRAIFRLLKTGRLRPKHFEPRLGGTYLTDAGRRRFVEAWDERLRRTVKHRGLGRHVSYERLVRLDAYRLVRHLTDPGDPYVGFRAWW